VIGYSYAFRKLIVREKEGASINSIWEILSGISLGLLKTRVMISIVSILSEYWVTYFSLMKSGTTPHYVLPDGVKRFLLMKELILRTTWHVELFRQFH